MGGCSFGSAGSVCWGDWWIPLVFLLLIAIAGVAGIAAILRKPSVFDYYRSKRNLVVLPLTFVGYMATSLILQAVLRQAGTPLWVYLLAGILPVSILVFGLRAGRRSPPAR